jgi:hypothetical protein
VLPRAGIRIVGAQTVVARPLLHRTTKWRFVLLSIKLMQEARTESRREGEGVSCESSERSRQLASALGGSDLTDSPIGFGNVVEALHRPKCHSPYVFDKAKTQYGRDRPQLAKCQGGLGLEGIDEQVDVVDVEPALCVRDESNRELVYPRISGKLTGGEFRQLSVVALRKCLPDLLDVFFHHIEIVQQPFARRSEVPLSIGTLREPEVNVFEDAVGFIQADEQRCLSVQPSLGRKHLARGYIPRPLGETIGPEQSPPDRSGESFRSSRYVPSGSINELLPE